jgi:hypothetical protein
MLNQSVIHSADLLVDNGQTNGEYNLYRIVPNKDNNQQ